MRHVTSARELRVRAWATLALLGVGLMAAARAVLEAIG